MLSDDIFLTIKSYFRVVDCGTCSSEGSSVACEYCVNRDGNNMWDISDDYARQLTEELMKIYER